MSSTAIGAGIALVATIPLVLILIRPVSSVLFVRGTEHYGDWGHAAIMILVLLAPATYTLFFATASEALKTRVNARVRRSTMRFAAAAMLPYLALCTLGVFWRSGPAEALLTVSGLTIPIAMAATVWFSGNTKQVP